MSPFEAPFAPDRQPDRQPAGLVLEDAVWAAALLATDPALGGMALRAWSGPRRDDYLANLQALSPRATRKMPPGIADDRLLGGLDLAATLQAGRPVHAAGLLADSAGGILLAAMAERMSAGTAARLAAAMDDGAGFMLVALDEGVAEEAPPAALLDRLAFTVHGAALPDAAADWPAAWQVAMARRNLAATRAADDAVPQICAAAAMLGVAAARAEIFTLRAARAAAALQGRAMVAAEDIALAVRLVLAPRATQVPAPPPQPEPEPAEDPTPQDRDSETIEPLEDKVADAAPAKLPPELLAALLAGGPRRNAAGAGKSGATASHKRGRPVGARPGALAQGARLALLDTLRAAAPWQRLRNAAPGRLQIRADDFRIRKFKENPKSIAIFAVDASGSSAVNRLAEAKGAIQLLLAQCYVRRDQVALIAFRGRAAEALLPPTHALARAKRALAALPGGGPTPLATGIAAARALAAAESRKGHKPLLVLLTDGGANIGRDGAPGRVAAAADALAAARACRAANVPALVVDTAPRGNAFVAALAREMAGRYLKLPYADAGALSRAVQAGGANGRAA